MAINRDGDGPPLRREDARTKPPADGLRASPFTEDVFDDEYYGRRPRSSGLSFSTVVGVVFFAAVVAAAGWYILAERSNAPATADGSGEMVRADPNPYKVKPEDPGGLQVANQDKLIYDDRLGKGPAPKQKENLLPAPEEPRAPPVKAPEPKAEAKSEPKSEEAKPPEKAAPAPKSDAKAASADPMADLMAKVEGMRKPEPETAAPPPPPPSAELKAGPTKEPKMPPPASAGISGAATPAPSASPPAPAPVAAAPPPPSAPAASSPMLLVPAAGNQPAPAPTPAPPTAVASAAPPVASPPPPTAPVAEPVVAGQVPVIGAIYVQLASAPTADGAMSEWKRLNNKYSDLLGNLAPSVSQAEIPDKGTVFRLRAGPISDRTAAQDLCGNLIARGLRCLIVKP